MEILINFCSFFKDLADNLLQSNTRVQVSKTIMLNTLILRLYIPNRTIIITKKLNINSILFYKLGWMITKLIDAKRSLKLKIKMLSQIILEIKQLLKWRKICQTIKKMR